MSNPAFRSFDSRDALAEKLADDVCEQLHAAIAKRGEATLVVSGGSTPTPFFKALRARDLSWKQIKVLVADERWVMPDHDDSNEKLVREHLQPESIISLAPMMADENLHDGAVRIEHQLKAMTNPFDVVILGMGEDGHTASLFPNHVVLEEGLNLQTSHASLPVEDSPKPPPQRITLTAKRLMNCENLILHITGDAKKSVYETALQTDDVKQYPIAALLKNTNPQPTIYWAA